MNNYSKPQAFTWHPTRKWCRLARRKLFSFSPSLLFLPFSLFLSICLACLLSLPPLKSMRAFSAVRERFQDLHKLQYTLIKLLRNNINYLLDMRDSYPLTLPPVETPGAAREVYDQSRHKPRSLGLEFKHHILLLLLPEL